LLPVRCLINVRLKKRFGCYGREYRPLRGDLYRHHFQIRGQVVQFFAIGSPAGRMPASCGNLRLSSRSKERPHINLILARFVRLIRHPFPVRRKHSLLFIERRAEEGKWFTITVDRQQHQVTVIPPGPVQNKSSVRRPGVGALELRRLQKKPVVRRTIRRFFVKVVGSLAIRGEYDPSAVRRPDWIAVIGPIKREPTAADAFLQPNVGGTNRPAHRRYAFAVRRKLRTVHCRIADID